MTLLLVSGSFLSLVGENSYLLGLTILDNLSLYGCTCNVGSANCKSAVVVYSNYLVKSNCVISVNCELLNEDLVAFLDLILLSACFDNSELFTAPAFS